MVQRTGLSVKSKDQFQAELQLTHVDAGTRAGNLAECIRCRGGVRIPEVRVIEKIERLKPELQVGGFRNGELLQSREIHTENAGAGDDVTAKVPVSSDRIERNSSRIKPAGGTAVAGIQIDFLPGHRVGPVVAVPGDRAVRARENAKREAAGRLQDASELPAT